MTAVLTIPACRRVRGAFTLVEVLVTFLIIAILGTLLMAGISSAKQSIRKKNTEATLTSLEAILDEYKVKIGAPPRLPDSFLDQRDPFKGQEARAWQDPTAAGVVNDAILRGFTRDFVAKCEQISTTRDLLKRLGTYYREYDPVNFPGRMSIFDAWDHEVFYCGRFEPGSIDYAPANLKPLTRFERKDRWFWSAGKDGINDSWPASNYDAAVLANKTPEYPGLPLKNDDIGSTANNYKR